MIDKLVLESKTPTNSLSIQIPFSYASELIKLNWNDILFAVRNGYFDKASALEYAVLLLDNDENNGKIIDLACLNPSDVTQEEILQFIVDFADKVPENAKAETSDKIMYILLNQLFENKNIFEDPFRVIEIVYDDFNFPKSIENLIRYMSEDSFFTIEQLEINWIEYLCSQKIKYGITQDQRQ